MKIAVVGTGYVGFSLAVLFAQKHEVVTVDIDQKKIAMVNSKKSPIRDEYIEKYLIEKSLDLRATTDTDDAFSNADFIIIATPTDYDSRQDYFDTSSVEGTLENIQKNYKKTKNAVVVIKSTIPVGFVSRVKEKYPALSIVFSPEFLREGKALYDNLYPSRIIVGGEKESAKRFADLLADVALTKDTPILLMDSTEAEAVKLFSNTFLALRVSYFNELDTYAEAKNLNARDIIKGVSLDPRIGDFYNNPSFGYGGYCLPKDTKQLLANYKNVPQNLIKAIVEANATRKQFIVDEVLSRNPETVGIYRLTMKSSSDNFRASAILDIILLLQEAKKRVIVYEPTIFEDNFNGAVIVNDLAKFKTESSIILANRVDDELSDCTNKIFTRDLWERD